MNFASRANAWATRDDREECLCELHEVWHDPGFPCPRCEYEEAQERQERALVKAGEP